MTHAKFIVILAIWFCIAAQAHAESSITRITPDKTADGSYSFAIKVQKRFHEGRFDCLEVHVTVNKKHPEKGIPAGRHWGQLEIFDGNDFVSSCELNRTGNVREQTFTFRISPQQAEKSRFTFAETPAGENETGQGFYYWFYLGDFTDKR